MDIHTPKLQKSWPSENLEMPQDIRNIGTQFSLLKSHVMREFSVLNQKIYLLSENLEKTLNYMKFENRNVYLLHENIKILQNDSGQKNKVMRCVIWYYLHNLKNEKNTHGGVLLLVKLKTAACDLTKSNTPPWVFFTFFKLYKWYQIAQRITMNFLENYKKQLKAHIITLSWALAIVLKS